MSKRIPNLLGLFVVLSLLLPNTQLVKYEVSNSNPDEVGLSISGKWYWYIGPFWGYFYIVQNGSSFTGTLDDVWEGTYGDKIINGTINGNFIAFTRDGIYGFQDWHGDITDNNGVLEITNGQWKKDGSTIWQPFLANKLNALTVPLFYQGYPSTPPNVVPIESITWRDETYGNKLDNPDGDTFDTVGRWGCNTTSNAMIIDYYAKMLNPSILINPGILNTWLRDNQGYDDKSYVRLVPYGNSGSVQGYAKLNGIPLSITSLGYNPQQVDASLEAGNPVMLQVRWPTGANCHSPSGICTHYFVATGKTTVTITGTTDTTDTYTINDPILGQTTLYPNYPTPSAAVYYSLSPGCSIQNPACIDHSLIQTIAYSPVHLLVTDPQGRKEGFDPRTGTNWNDIPDASYLIDAISGPDGNTLPEIKTLSIYHPIAGSYSIEVIGYDSGSFEVDVNKTTAIGATTVETHTGTAQPFSVEEITTNYIPYNLFLPMILSETNH